MMSVEDTQMVDAGKQYLRKGIDITVFELYKKQNSKINSSNFCRL